VIFDHDELGRAVLFFGQEGLISKEMLYTEFEALLDGYVPAAEWKNQTLKAALVEMDSKFRLRTAVFFVVGFDARGDVDKRWRLPMEQLVNSAQRGPDLGAGPIRLVCASQCPIKFFQSYFWDPNLNAAHNQLHVLKKAVERNRLSLQFRDPPDDENTRAQAAGAWGTSLDAELLEKRISQELRKEYAQEFRDHMAQILKDHRLCVATLTNENQTALTELKIEHGNRIEEYRAIIEEKNRLLEQETARNAALKEIIDGQAKKIEGLREYFEHKLEKAEDDGVELVAGLKENYAAESAAKIEAATTELKDLLQMREVELMYRHEQETQLRNEIARLRQENQAMLGSSDDDLLGKLVSKGISFVTYQPGAGHITIPVAEIPDYLDSPAAYAAKQCGVTEPHYKAWLAHYQAPVCFACDEHGNMCGENLPRVDNPADFHSGDQDRCSAHKEFLSVKKNLKLVNG